MQTVYVLRSDKDGKLYIGCTSNLAKRILQHNNGNVVSTKSRGPLKLVYFEVFEDKYKAFFSEKFYKTAKGKRELLGKI